VDSIELRLFEFGYSYENNDTGWICKEKFVNYCFDTGLCNAMFIAGQDTTGQVKPIQTGCTAAIRQKTLVPWHSYL
jgi:hypothetical protein